MATFASSVFCRRSTTEMSFDAPDVMKAFELSGRIAICSGWLAAEIVPSEASELASSSEIVESSRLETMRTLPSGVTRAIHGRRPARPRRGVCGEAPRLR